MVLNNVATLFCEVFDIFNIINNWFFYSFLTPELFVLQLMMLHKVTQKSLNSKKKNWKLEKCKIVSLKNNYVLIIISLMEIIDLSGKNHSLY